MMVRIAALEIDPLQLETYLDFLTEEIEISLAHEPGVRMLKAVSLKDAPHMVRLLEVYEDQEAYEAHIRSPHFLNYKAGTANMVTSLLLLDADPIAL